MKLGKKFIAVASLMAGSALSSGVQAQEVGVNADLSGLQTQLNLNQNTFYHPAAGVRIDEVCETKGDAIQCDMTIINGGDNRVQTATFNYGVNKAGALIAVSATSNKAQYYTANGSFEGNDTNTATGSDYDERMAATSRPDLDAKLDVANQAGAKTPYDHIISRIGNSDSYFTAGDNMTAIETAVADAGIFAYDGKYRPLDRLVRLNDLGSQTVSEVGCILIPPAGVDKLAYDADLPQSSRMLCIEKEYQKGPITSDRSLNFDFKKYGKVDTTYNMYALSSEGTVVDANVVDSKVYGATALGAISSNDLKGHKATVNGLTNPDGVREKTGNRIRPAL